MHILSQTIWIFRDFDRCSGCRLCEIVCALRQEGMMWVEASRIKVFEFAPGVLAPHLCMQCYDYPCIKACPTGALYVDSKTGAVKVDGGKCILCRKCIEACPAKVPRIVKGKKYVIICDLCDGSPECVKACEAAGFYALKVIPRPEKAYMDPYITLPENVAVKVGEKVLKDLLKQVI